MATISSIPGLDEALANIDAGSRDGRPVDGDGVRGTYKDLPETQEFRGEVTEATYKHSQAGNEGIRFVLTIVEDGGKDEYVGQKVWSGVYFTGHEMQGQILGTLLAAAEAPRSGVTIEQAADLIVGGKVVFAVKPGQDPRYPETRWINVDLGQKLNMNVKPYKPKGAANPAALTSSPPIPPKPAVVTPPVTIPVPVVAGGIKLPGA